MSVRVMFEMVKYVNSEFMPKVFEIRENQHEIKCYTCHAGNEEPLVHPKFR
ncbi:photosynthetic reaction center cytochrome c subunit [Candidatus Marinimicrobia bacterium MT.SAG.4]|nr:photosynthetic reaction center cytochrome c subunit [Candidatus Marinimicrobia bacterium MT.SAG.4]